MLPEHDHAGRTGYFELLKSRRYVRIALSHALCFAAQLTFVASAPFSGWGSAPRWTCDAQAQRLGTSQAPWAQISKALSFCTQPCFTMKPWISQPTHRPSTDSIQSSSM